MSPEMGNALVKWVCRSELLREFGQSCTPDSGGKPGTLCRNCGWVEIR